jgi:hypothetical protein
LYSLLIAEYSSGSLGISRNQEIVDEPNNQRLDDAERTRERERSAFDREMEILSVR